MSAMTKANLLELNTQLRSKLAELRQETERRIAVFKEQVSVLKRERDAVTVKLDQEQIRTDHYKAQRDGLIGYVEGSRVDRDDDVLVREDAYSEPVRTKQTDRFLEDMGRDPDSPRRF